MWLHDFDVLTFDCYGTLIDWETGIWDALQPLIRAGGLDPSRDQALETFARFESAQQRETPGMRYPELLAAVHARIAGEWGIATTAALDERFGASVPHWPAFADSATALRYLGAHYRLVILSNVDRAGFAASNEKLGVELDAVYTAEEIGSYKPAARNFEYLLEHERAQGIEPAAILHTAQSLFHDHEPANAAGLATNWIDRRMGKEGFGATMAPGRQPRIDFHFASMAEFAAAHRAEGDA